MSNTEEITGNTIVFTGNVYEQINRACREAGIPLQHVCNEAGINRSVPEVWKKKDPKSVQTINALMKALEKLKKQKTQTHE